MPQPYTPRFLQPDPEGQLSNTHVPSIKSRYMNSRGSADPAGQVRVWASRIGASPGASPSSSQTVWDMGYTGQSTINPLPTGLRGPGVTNFNGRIYVCGGVDGSGTVRSDVWSAPFNGGSVGTWRVERPMEVVPGPSAGSKLSPRALMGCTAANFVPAGLLVGSSNPGIGDAWLLIYGGQDEYSNVLGNFIGARINPDGTLAPWVTIQQQTSALAYHGFLAIPSVHLTTALVLCGGITTLGGAPGKWGWCAPVLSAPSNPADWKWGWQAIPDMNFAAAGHFACYDAAWGVLMAFRGTAGSGAYTGEQSIGLWVDATSGTVGTSGSWVGGSAQGAARNNPAGVYFPAKDFNSHGTVYLFGGSTGSDQTTAVTSVEYSDITGPGVVGGAPSYGSWVTSAQPLPAASALGRAVIGQYPPNAQFALQTDARLSRVAVLGGGNGSSNSLSDVYTSTLPPLVGGGDLAAWRGGASGAIGSGLASGDLGTGGSIVTSSDATAPAGAQDVTINYGAVGSASALADSDQIQINITYNDRLGGDPSPIGSTIIRIGQPPSISNLAASSGTGQPIISWAFNAGSGGGTQYSWRCVVTRNSDSLIMFDSGSRQGQLNSVQAQCAPMLANGIAYTATVTVVATDNPMSGSTATTTATLGITPALATAPSTPSSVSAAGDTANKWMLLSWTNAVGTTANRIYYRYSGTLNWRLLVDNYTAGSGAQSVKLMDKIPLGVAMDYSVSALGGAAASESALSTPLSATIPADAATPSGYLHLAGQPLTGALGVAVQGQTQPELNATYASKVFTRFNSSRAVLRQGTSDYRTLALEITSVYGASVRTLEALVDYLLQGNVLFWRDRLGAVLPVGLDSPENVKTLYPSHRVITLKLVQVDDLFSPYVSSGSAQGIPTLFGGSIPPLDDATEQVA